uniref:Immunoglobulin V-set domain-containing protein n=1 Tax=Salarias fasciatus TaxID=181472 RepID=A0A672JNZ3_SALFA
PLFIFLFFSLSCSLSFPSGNSSVPPVFVQKGKDVPLDVDNVPEDFLLFVWRLDEESLSLVTFFPDGNSKISKAYTGRIDIPDNKKYSVILKNLQETDSGVYSAREITDDGELTLVQHNIIVQDVVSPVQLEVNSVSNSSHSCNVTLTCSTADSHISSTFRCDSQKCDQDGGNQSKITNSSSTLQVYLLDVTVICKHRNQVSSTEDRTDIQHVCPQLIGRLIFLKFEEGKGFVKINKFSTLTLTVREHRQSYHHQVGLSLWRLSTQKAPSPLESRLEVMSLWRQHCCYCPSACACVQKNC